MSSLYRLVCLYKAPAAVSKAVFLKQKMATVDDQATSDWLKSQGCVNWHYATPLQTDASAFVMGDWVSLFDFDRVAQAHAVQAALLSSLRRNTSLMWYSAIGRVHQLKSAPQGHLPPISVMRCAQKNPALNLKAFSEYWRDQHAPLAIQSPFLAHYEQVHLCPATPQAAAPWHGFTFSFFNETADIQHHAHHPAGAAAATDTVHFLSPEPQPFITLQIQQHPAFQK